MFALERQRAAVSSGAPPFGILLHEEMTPSMQHHPSHGPGSPSTSNTRLCREDRLLDETHAKVETRSELFAFSSSPASE